MRNSAIAMVAVVAVVAATGCNGETQLERLTDARQLSADVLLQFTRAAAAGNNAVMADTDEASIAFAREAGQATQAAQKDADALAPVLTSLGYAEETRLLGEFSSRFAEYRALDRTILELAVENTNLKAQRLSFSQGQEAADAFRDALGAVVPQDAGDGRWHVAALGATAVAAVREIQALQAPHIAAADDAVMTGLETRIAGAETAARSALTALAPLLQPSSRSRLAAATAALDAFMGVHAQVAVLSRRNTNVRSLALALNQKGALTSACEERLRGLRDALARRELTGTR